jgi:hypothetical protein
MSIYDLIETKFTEINGAMQKIDPATGKPDPNEVTIPRQGMINGLLVLTSLIRNAYKYGYLLYIIGLYLLIKLHLRKAPEFKSAIPGAKPQQ